MHQWSHQCLWFFFFWGKCFIFFVCFCLIFFLNPLSLLTVLLRPCHPFAPTCRQASVLRSKVMALPLTLPADLSVNCHFRLSPHPEAISSWNFSQRRETKKFHMTQKILTAKRETVSPPLSVSDRCCTWQLSAHFTSRCSKVMTFLAQIDGL